MAEIVYLWVNIEHLGEKQLKLKKIIDGTSGSTLSIQLGEFNYHIEAFEVHL